MMTTRRNWKHWGEALLVDTASPQRQYQAIPAAHRVQLLRTHWGEASGIRVLDFRLPGDRRRRTFHRVGAQVEFAFPCSPRSIVAKATIQRSYLRGDGKTKTGICVLDDWEWVSNRYTDVTVPMDR